MIIDQHQLLLYYLAAQGPMGPGPGPKKAPPAVRPCKFDLIPIKFNFKKTKLGKGSAIFIHLTKNYIPTAGCIGISEKDFLILIKLINKNTKIKIL